VLVAGVAVDNLVDDPVCLDEELYMVGFEDIVEEVAVDLDE